MANKRFWLSAAAWLTALVVTLLVAGPAVGWAVLAVAGFAGMSAGVVLVAGGRRRPLIGWPLLIGGIAVGILGIVLLARAL